MTFENTLRELLGRGLAVRFRARGHSMHPTIRSGDELHVVPVAAADLARGDVILARQERGLTAHRVVRIDGARIVTRGDNCAHDDPAFTAGDVLGRIVLTNFSRWRRRFAVAGAVLWQLVQ